MSKKANSSTSIPRRVSGRLLQRINSPNLVWSGLLTLVLHHHIDAQINMHLPSHVWISRLVQDIGMSMLIAGLLGISLDRFLKLDFAKDIFQATFGYLLPDQLRGQMKWMYSQEFIATSTYIKIDLCRSTSIGKNASGCIDILFHIRRRIQNYSSGYQYLTPMFEIDQTVGKSRINLVRISHAGGTESFDETSDTVSPFSISRKGNPVLVAPNDHVDIEIEWEGVRPSPGNYAEVFLTATSDPAVDISHPDDLDVIVDFPIRGEREPHPVGQANRHLWRMKDRSTILPFLSITIRWKDRTQAD